MNDRASVRSARHAADLVSSDKDFVTTALGPARLWATVGHGVLNEVFWPSTGNRKSVT